MEEDKVCRCGCNTDVRDKYGDTSIGHSSVWHGNVDVFVGDEDLPVTIVIPEGPDSHGGRTPTETPFRESIDNHDLMYQMIAQTIVFSFWKKKRQPDAKHFLIPCVGMSSTQMIFYFYDAVNDILLLSRPMPLKIENEMNYNGIIALWLVLNYQHFGCGPSKFVTENAPKSNFLQNAKECIKRIYEEQLHFGNIIESDEPDKYDVVSRYKSRYIYPPDIPEFSWPEADN